MEGWLLPVCCLAAVVVLGLALQYSGGSLEPRALRNLTWALVLCTVGVLGPRLVRPWTWGHSLLTVLLGVGLALQLRKLTATSPGAYVQPRPGWSHEDYLEYMAMAALVAGALVFCSARVRRWLLPTLLVLHFLAGVWMLHVSPAPFIDVFVFQTQGVDELLRGRNPYAMTFPNIYGGTQYYGEGLVVDGRLQFGFPYPPLSLYLSTVARVLAGDPRYAQLVAMELAAALMAFSRGGRLGAGAAALYLLTPRNLFVLEQAWTEPFLVLLLAATVFCACRWPRALPYALGLMLAVKQYTVFFVPLVLLLVPWRGRQAWGVLWRAAATAAVVSLPLVLSNVEAFIHSAVTLQVHQPFRTDALSYLAWWVSLGHPPPPTWVAFAAVALALALALWRAPRSPAGFAAASALVYATFFAFNKQAFCNYYFFVVGALCVAVAAARPPSPEQPAQAA
jgi:hypothetical protein